MKVRNYQDTSLWKNAFSDVAGCPHNSLRKGLVQIFDNFRERAADLTNEIHALLPNLTVHNVEHLDALWDVASTIAGESYSLNPLEAFVLGGAILVHDAGMALATFPGRMEDVKKHPRWPEHERASWRRRGVEAEPTSDERKSFAAEVEQEAAFDIVRAEHARNSEKLLSLPFSKNQGGERYYLLQDDRLREAYGELIGLIAASHNWSVADLTKRLPLGQIPAAHPYPKEWTINAIKLACLLRCADAANIDETRAPSFVYAMRRPDKVSREHWEFQNLLLPAQPEGEALVFHSKKAFEEKDAAVWWLCFETVRMCNEQIQQSAALLGDMDLATFSIRRVKNADDPRRLAETVKVSGWTPVDTSVKVTDVLGLVRALGGQELYGDDPHVPLRELIQNAADAIRARRAIDTNFYVGQPEHRRGLINIRLENDDALNDKFWLIVEDDGVGMTPWVMTGPLLDFGTSFWRSSKAGEELPGLVVGQGFEPGGRFEIGFYSVFMYADVVKIVSRPADPRSGGHGEAHTLEFKNGLTRRPLLRGYRAVDDGYLGPTISTRVAIRMKKEILLAWETARSPSEVRAGRAERAVSLQQKLQWMVLGLDVGIELRKFRAETELLHQGSYAEISSDELLYRSAIVRKGEYPEFDEIVSGNSARVSAMLDELGRIVGRGIFYDRYYYAPKDYRGDWLSRWLIYIRQVRMDIVLGRCDGTSFNSKTRRLGARCFT